MPFLLDTVTISELRKKDKADPRVWAWQESNRGIGYISVVSLNEIWFGIRKVERTDHEFAERLVVWYHELCGATDFFKILSVDLAIATCAADFRYDNRMGYNDSLIAATAQIGGLTLATRDIGDFGDLGIALVNPWEFDSGSTSTEAGLL